MSGDVSRVCRLDDLVRILSVFGAGFVFGTYGTAKAQAKAEFRKGIMATAKVSFEDQESPSN